MGNDIFEVPLLTSSNYAEWRVRITDRLIDKGLVRYIREGATRDTEEALEKDERALAQIRARVSMQMLSYLDGVTTAREAWTMLEGVSRSTMQAKILQLEEDLLHLKMRKTEDVTEYCARARRMQLELASVGQPLDNQKLIRRVLMGLPKEYSVIKNILLFQETVDIDRAVAQLKVAEESMGMKTQEEATALSVDKGKQKHRKQIKCFKCGKLGHIKRNCPEMSKGGHDSVAMSASTMHSGTCIDDLSWVVDSGATDHILRDVRFAKGVRKTSQSVLIANGQKVQAKGIGTVEMTVQVGSRKIDVSLSDVLIVPEAPYNLLSVTAIMHKGGKVVASNAEMKVYAPNGMHMGTAPVTDGLAVLRCTSTKSEGDGKFAMFSGKTGIARSAVDRAKLWHQRLGHVSNGALQAMQRNQMVLGWEKEPQFPSTPVCDTCMSAKQAAAPFPPSSSKTKAPLELLHTDLMGPFTPISAGKSQYIITIMDDYSGFAAVKPLKHKSDASAALKHVVCLWERQLVKKVKCVRSDRGGEFVSFDAYCTEVGIRREKSVAYCPQSNGKAERLNRTLTERVRGMLIASKIPKKFWGDAFDTAGLLYNLCPKVDRKETSYELFFGRKPDVSRLRVFGCAVYSLIHAQARKKLDAKSEKGRLIGYEDGTKGWKILLDDGRVVIRRHCSFDETQFVDEAARYISYESSDDEDDTVADVPATAASTNVEDNSAAAETEDDDVTSTEDDSSHQPADANIYARWQVPDASDVTPAKRDGPITRSVARERNVNRRVMMALNASQRAAPVTYTEMLKRADADHWHQATDDEIQALTELGVFEVVPLPPDTKPLTGKWVFELKCGKDGAIERYRARLVARGHKQREGIDFGEVFAPVAKPETTRMLLAYAAANDLEIEQVDVKTAFLYGDLQEEIYMQPPEGYDFGKGMVWKLKKSLYGLKQAARAWHETLRSKLVSAGFEVAHADSSLFMCSKGTGTITYLLVYVDDGLIVGTRTDVQVVVDLLETHFKIRKMGEVQLFLGTEVIRHRQEKTIVVTQRKYAQKIVQVAGQTDAKVRSVPLDVNAKFSKLGEDMLSDHSKYAEVLGMLMYLANGTRPDLSYSVGVLARFMSAPRQEHWRALIGVVRYLKGTLSYGLQYDGKVLGELVGYSDSDFGGDPDKRRSTTGYVFMLAGGVISWASKLQPTVAASTTEAEYMAAAHATKEALWLRKLMGSFGQVDQNTAIQMHGDNQASIAIMKNPTSHQRAKHIDIQHHFVRDRVQRGEVKFDHVESKRNLADMMTKAVSPIQLKALRESIGLVQVHN